MLGDNDFYIFMIWNKSFASNVKVYDMKENTLFENGDVTVRILDEVGDLEEFLTNAKAMVKERSYSYNSQRSSYASTAAAAKPAAGTGPYKPALPDGRGSGRSHHPRSRPRRKAPDTDWGRLVWQERLSAGHPRFWRGG